MSSGDANTRIALIHALEESVGPAREAFAQLWPEAFTYDLLDTSLAVDRAHAGRLDGAMVARFHALAEYASAYAGKGGATAGILFTCSAFGPAIDAVKNSAAIPVIRPNEAAFESALEAGDRIGLVVSFEPSRASLERELRDMAGARHREVTVACAVAEGALEALKAGDGARHDRLVADAVARLPAVDVIVLGQFSLARARDLASRTSPVPIITTPHSAVEALKTMVQARQKRG
ncbi:MAG TPA: aspartate/glutamate racemase family protein [Roseiarcus sp.]|jgi:Asp/Glu/hydantoin racemase